MFAATFDQPAVEIIKGKSIINYSDSIFLLHTLLSETKISLNLF